MSEDKNLVTNKEFKFKKFEDIPVSTKTFIIVTNVSINLPNLHDFLPMTDYVIVPKKRGRKKKITIPDPNTHIKEGAIITNQYGNSIKGVILKKKKKNHASSIKYFRNSLTEVVKIADKFINFKVCRNGVFQMTGCKREDHAERCVKIFWDMIKDNKNLYNFKNDEKDFKAIFLPAMSNIDFSLGFNVDREKLDEFFNQHFYNSLLETSIGYTGVNIKFRNKISILDIKIKTMQEKDGVWIEPFLVNYKDYFDTLPDKLKQKVLDKDEERNNTFLVFHSGKCILSSVCSEFAESSYYEFLDIVKKNYKYFEEKLEVIKKPINNSFMLTTK
jgi:TATA-box binding protein (TBP) (component of TFIID and TFIIIB)